MDEVFDGPGVVYECHGSEVGSGGFHRALDHDVHHAVGIEILGELQTYVEE